MARKETGVTVIEMVVGLIIIIPVMLVMVDMILLNLTQQANDNAAREAVRLAAAGDPAQAQLRAQEAIDRIAHGTGGYASNLKMSSFTFSPTDLLTQEATMTKYGGLLRGSVTVNTQVTVTPIAVSFYTNGPVTFYAQQTCPITFSVPNTAGGLPTGL